MAKTASDTTLLRRERADNKRLRAELSLIRQDWMKADLKAERLAKEVEEWKARFDALLKRDTALS